MSIKQNFPTDMEEKLKSSYSKLQQFRKSSTSMEHISKMTSETLSPILLHNITIYLFVSRAEMPEMPRYLLHLHIIVIISSTC